MTPKKIALLIGIVFALLALEPTLAEGSKQFIDSEARQKGQFTVVADRRVFAMMTFIDILGYANASDYSGDGLWAAVVDDVSKNLERNGYNIEEWKKSILGQEAISHSYAFEDYALTLSSSYPFRQLVPRDKIAYPFLLNTEDNLPGVLNDFWKSGGLDLEWEKVRSSFMQEVDKYDFSKMQSEVDEVWKYLKTPRKDNFTFVMIPNLMDPRTNAIGAKYGNFFYSVESPGSATYGINIHEYLHSYINGLVLSHLSPYREKFEKYYEGGKSGKLSSSYQELGTFVYECLVRALTNRISYQSLAQMNYESNNGLNLVRPFYVGLKKYEAQDQPIERYIDVLFAGVPSY